MTCERCKGTGTPPRTDIEERFDGDKELYCSCLAGIRKQFENVPGAVVVENAKTFVDEDNYGWIEEVEIPFSKAGFPGTLIFIPDEEEENV